MITPVQLAEAFARNVWIVEKQAAGLTNEDSLRQPPFRGNCLNWVLGHMVTNRDIILEWLGETPVGGERASRYRRESEPVTGPAAELLPLDELLALLNASQQKLAAALGRLTEADLEREVVLSGKGSPLRKRVFFLYFHDTYHTGQTELLRQLSGVGDKVL